MKSSLILAFGLLPVLATAQTAYPINGTSPPLSGHPGCPGVNVSTISSSQAWLPSSVPPGVDIVPNLEYVHHHAPAGELCSSTYADSPSNPVILPKTTIDKTDTTTQCLDIYKPHGAVNPPLIIFAHAGTWSSGHRTDSNLMTTATWLAQNTGFAVALYDYRLAVFGSTTNRFPAGIQDSRCAVRWLKYNAAKYGYDASHIGFYGNSIGGTIVGMLGSQLNTDPGLYGPLPTPLTKANNQPQAPLDSPDCGDTIAPGFNLNAAEDLSGQAVFSQYGHFANTLERDYLQPNAATALAGTVTNNLVSELYNAFAIGPQGSNGDYNSYLNDPGATSNAKYLWAVTNNLMEGATNQAQSEVSGESYAFYQTLRNAAVINPPPVFMMHGAWDVEVTPWNSADMFNALTGVFTLAAPHQVVYANQSKEILLGLSSTGCTHPHGPLTPCDQGLYQGSYANPIGQSVTAANNVNGNPVTLWYIPGLGHLFWLFSNQIDQNPVWAAASCASFNFLDQYLKP